MKGTLRAFQTKPIALGAALTIGVAVCTPSSARAENPGVIPDPIAQALFQDGRDLVDKGNWDAGCTKFEASMLLYPAASTLLNIARCHEHKQKLATAWSAYKRVQVLNRETVGDERRRAIDEVVAAEITRLTPRLPKIKLTMKNEVAGISLKQDGEVLPAAVIGTEVPIDVGEHEIIADAPGMKPFRMRFEAKESSVREIAIELIAEGAADPNEGTGKLPTWAFVTGGASLAFLGASAAFRIDQAFVEGRQDAICRGNVTSGCPPMSQYNPADDNTRKNIDFGLFVGFGAAGVAALAATIYGIVRSSSDPPRRIAGFTITREGAFVSAAFQF
ncbi:MAG: hypothetical protein IPK82_15915 [Polyangiaceae bacterium]|nr:hypothetical protein [Polyangiaceae bacterium]